MSRNFTQKEQDLLTLMNQADNLAQTLRHETRNKDGFYDTMHPLANLVGQLSISIDEMLDRMQLVN